jgi:hypothetical protein
VNAAVIVAGLVITAAIIAFIMSWRRTDLRSDLGAVSHQWISEHRLGSEQDARR